jgi:uncharacterized protein (TIRG00374 family)
VAVLLYVLLRIDRQEALTVLSDADLLLLGAALGLTVIAMVGLTALRWRQLIAAQGMSASLGALAIDYMVGYAFNMILPGSVGGDVYRVIRLGDRTKNRSGALASVVTERLLGLVGLLPVGTVGLALTEVRLVGQGQFVLALSALSVILLTLPLWAHPRVVRLLRPVYSRLFRHPLARRFSLQARAVRLYGAFSTYTRRALTLVLPLVATVVARLMWTAAAYLTGRAIGMRLSYPTYMAVLSITELVRMLPISLGGVGVREGAFVVLLAPFGVSSGRAFMLSFLFYLMLTALGVAGGVIYAVLGLKASEARSSLPAAEDAAAGEDGG